jgi:hypothetical protein
LLKGLLLSEELFGRTALGATEEQAMESGKERCCISHN